MKRLSLPARKLRIRPDRGWSRLVRRIVVALLVAVCASAAMVIAPTAARAEDRSAGTVASTFGRDGREATADELSADLELSEADRAALSSDPSAAGTSTGKSAANRRTAGTAPTTGTGQTPIGGTKIWFTLDTVRGVYVAYRFVLRALGEHIEVWVQENTDFPAGDCRNDGVRNVVTQAQAEDLAAQFDDTILPRESAAFSVAPGRDGSKEKVIGDGSGYFTGNPDTTVALVANVRDPDFYTPTAPEGATYITGFFSPDLTEYFDRNVMTIDSYDWTHRTGANPPATTATCLPRPALPRLYESTFAHEYQHLLEYYQDRTEATWLNEGLSTYAQTLTGYSDTRLQYPATGADTQIACFQGLLANDAFPYCGAENSLTRWGDQGATSILADYGAAYSFVTYVADHYGAAAITALHRSPLHGLASLQDYLEDHAVPGLSASDVLHDWAAAMAVDALVDDGARGLWGSQSRRFSSAQLHSRIAWDFAGSYDSAGAPPNGSDYVLANIGRTQDARCLESITFQGGASFGGSSSTAVTVAGWSVQMIGWSRDGRVVRVVDLPLDARNQVRLGRSAIRDYLPGVDRVGFVVTADDPTETAAAYAPYALRVNNRLLPGGGTLGA